MTFGFPEFAFIERVNCLGFTHLEIDDGIWGIYASGYIDAVSFKSSSMLLFSGWEIESCFIDT